MDRNSTETPKTPAPPTARRGSQTAVAADLPPQPQAPDDIDPAMAASDEDDETPLPEASEEAAETVAEGPLAAGHAAIESAVRLAPTSPGVYRMLNAATTCSMSARPKTSASGLPPTPG